MRPMTQTELHVWEWLFQFARGRANGKHNSELARLCCLQERRLREAIASLVAEHGKPIGSHPDHGIFVIQDHVDALIAEQCLADHAFPLMRRMRALKATKRAMVAQAEDKSEQGWLFAQEPAT